MLAVLMGLTVSGCGGGEEALADASQACNEAMAKQSGESDEETVAARKAAADTAAEAAAADETWRDLAKATSDWVAMTENFPDPDLPTFLDDIQRFGEHTEEVKSVLTAECRAAKAAGGDVDEEILDDFNSLD